MYHIPVHVPLSTERSRNYHLVCIVPLLFLAIRSAYDSTSWFSTQEQTTLATLSSVLRKVQTHPPLAKDQQRSPMKVEKSLFEGNVPDPGLP